MNKYRIMTFDGGGVRGTLTVTLLKRLLKDCSDIINKTDLFAGTSTGSFIALGLAYGLSLDEIAKLYSEENAKYIFAPKNFELFKPKYKNNHLKELLTKVFPEKLRLSDLKRKVLIPSFKIHGLNSGNWGPVFFNNYSNSSNKHAKVIDVALSSSAAPVYFPSYRKYIDGGLVANNPSTVAVAKATDKNGGNQDINNIYLISFGTGFNPEKITADTTRWGAFEWAFFLSPPLPLLSILFDGISEVNMYLCSQLLGDRYIRVNPKLPKPISIDDYKSIPELVDYGNSFPLHRHLKWVKNYWN